MKNRIQNNLETRLSNRLVGPLILSGVMLASLYFFLQTSSEQKPRQTQNTFLIEKIDIPSTSYSNGRASMKIEAIDQELNDLIYDKRYPKRYKYRRASLESNREIWKRIEDVELKMSLRPEETNNADLLEQIEQWEVQLNELPKD